MVRPRCIRARPRRAAPGPRVRRPVRLAQGAGRGRGRRFLAPRPLDGRRRGARARGVRAARCCSPRPAGSAPTSRCFGATTTSCCRSRPTSPTTSACCCRPTSCPPTSARGRDDRARICSRCPARGRPTSAFPGYEPSSLGPGVDLLAGIGKPAWRVQDALVKAALVEASADAAEAWRIIHGIPRMGPTSASDRSPSEAGLEATIDTTKGCFLGQESVAQIATSDTRRASYAMCAARQHSFRVHPCWPAAKRSARSTSAAPARRRLRRVRPGRVGLRSTTQLTDVPVRPFACRREQRASSSVSFPARKPPSGDRPAPTPSVRAMPSAMKRFPGDAGGAHEGGVCEDRAVP